MTIISPSILSADFANLQRDLNIVKQAGAPWAHVDVMDGHFVPNITIGVPVVESLRKATDLVLDVHLMIDTPIKFVPQFAKAGSDLLTIHIESDTPENIHTTLKMIRQHGMKAGLSVKPGTPIEAVEPYLPECDMILVMTVEPGFGGQSFMADMMPKLRWLKEHTPEGFLIQVDGGVDAKTGPICKEAGANVLVSGSAFFKAADKAAFVKELQR